MKTIKTYPKITVVTPNYNQADFIETTIQSVLNQKYPNLEYLIIDGGSTDGSVAIIEKYKKELAFWSSEPDFGMYHAINKGFSKATGDIMCWINSDDVLWENSLFNVAKLFSENPKMNWLQGYPSVINENGTVIYKREQVYSKYYFYFRLHEVSFKFIQQESTFWTKELWDKTGAYLDTDYKLAADFDLWMRFFNYEKVYCTQLQLGAFRKRKGQMSSNQKSYIAETKTSINRNFIKLNLLDKFILKLYELLKLLKMPFIKRLKTKLQTKLIGQPIRV
ncbi:glycosyltransferase family 2 protein [uncultured Lutibacter sp.]|uniref:glycosyltransferase family 2 protein n=1 Tax=uncultured Lutibacter sp. TaxID=437739 RepID=UPI00261AD342|nr:glycosyltransferase family 2 protein [uncultured Lutibacter sp.]